MSFYWKNEFSTLNKAGKRLDEEAERQRFLFGSYDEQPDIRRPKLLICLPKRKHEDFLLQLERLHVKTENIVLLPPLSILEPSDSRLSQVKISLIEPKCSLSAAADPLQFLLMEGIDDDDARLSTLAAGRPSPQEGLKAVLAASLKLPGSAGVVYLTRSSLSKENEDVGKFWCHFLYGEFHIILKSAKMCEHSVFFNYWRKIYLRGPWKFFFFILVGDV